MCLLMRDWKSPRRSMFSDPKIFLASSTAASRVNSWALSFLMMERKALKLSNGSRVLTTLKNCFPSFPFESNELLEGAVFSCCPPLVFGDMLAKGGGATTKDTAGVGVVPEEEREAKAGLYSPERMEVCEMLVGLTTRSSSWPEFSRASLNVC